MNDHNRQQGEKTMTDHKTGTRKEWLAARSFRTGTKREELEDADAQGWKRP